MPTSHRTTLFTELIGDRDVPERTALFMPVHGIGDKLRFLSYLKLFEIFNECSARILVSQDFDQSLVDCFPELAQRTLPISQEVARMLFADGRLVDDRLSLFAGPGQVFPTWHRRYMHGQGIRWEQVNQPHIHHDLLVKQILHVPAAYLPAPIALPETATPRQRKILLAPFNVSNIPAPEDLWMALGEMLTAEGFVVVCNTSLGGRAPVFAQDYSRLFSRFEKLDVPITDLIVQLGAFSGVVSIRSGLSDLVSLTKVPAVTLTHSRIARFWDIPNHFGNHRQITFDITEASVLRQDILRLLSQPA